MKSEVRDSKKDRLVPAMKPSRFPVRKFGLLVEIRGSGLFV